MVLHCVICGYKRQRNEGMSYFRIPQVCRVSSLLAKKQENSVEIPNPDIETASVEIDDTSTYTNVDAEVQTDFTLQDFDTIQKSNDICLKMFEDDDRRTRFFTGLSSYAILSSLYEKIEPDLPFSQNLTKFQVFYITIVRMRLNLSFSFLAYQFKVHHSTISKYFHACLYVLYSRLKSLVYWPEKSAIKYTMPEIFKSTFQDQVVIIIDCFEV